MNKARGILTAFLCALVCVVSAQKQQKKKKASTSVAPYYPSQVYSPKVSKKKKSSSPVTYDAREKYYERIEQINKKRKKDENAEIRPEYSDFQYFGHKKPPKKRPPEKMKYCKICGIRH
jgi:hypothetical protein